MNTLGNKTRTIFLNHESHKLHLEFTASNTIKVGQPVKLHTDGTVRAYLTADHGTEPILGYALHDAAAAELVTVMVRGNLVLMCYSSAAIATTGIAKFIGREDNNTTGEHYNTVNLAAGLSTMGGWVLDTAGGANEEVRFLCMD